MYIDQYNTRAYIQITYVRVCDIDNATREVGDGWGWCMFWNYC